MDSISARAFRHVEDLIHTKIRLGCRSRADGVGLVGLTDMESGAVDVGINGDGGDAHFAASAYDAHRNLSPVGDQNLLEHSWLPRQLDAPCRPDFTCGNGGGRIRPRLPAVVCEPRPTM